MSKENLIKLGLKRGIKTFKISVQTTSPSETFTLPLIPSGTYNFIVHWGDVNVDTITAYNQAEITHTYTTADIYVISMEGTCTAFVFDGAGDCAKVRQLLEQLQTNTQFTQ